MLETISTDLRAEAEFVRDLARRVGSMVRVMQGAVAVRQKPDNQGPVTEADELGQKVIVEELRGRFPGDEILGEEDLHDANLRAPRLWCVDPVDGTKGLLDGTNEYAVHVGLLQHGHPAIGAVAIPHDDEVYWGYAGGGAFNLAGEPLIFPEVRPGRGLVAIASRSHMKEETQQLLDLLGPRHVIVAHSVGYKMVQIAQGRADLYVQASGTKWWDTVAPAAVFMAMGGIVGDRFGRLLRYNGSFAHDSGILFAAPWCRNLLRRLRSAP